MIGLFPFPLLQRLNQLTGTLLHQPNGSFTEDYPKTLNGQLSLFPIYIHLILMLGLGLLIPVFLVSWDEIVQLMRDFL